MEYLKTLQAVRAEAHLLLDNPQYLTAFDIDLSKLDDVVNNVLELIKRDYKSPHDIPAHSRWRHFEAGISRSLSIKTGKIELVNELTVSDKLETTRCFIDLFVVSVLLDADYWKYSNINGTFTRSEGLAIASFDMFKAGSFSSIGNQIVDSKGLMNLTPEILKKGFQISETNPMEGLEGRCGLLNKLGEVLESVKYFTIGSDFRPGYLVDHTLTLPTTTQSPSSIDTEWFWEMIMASFQPVWPESRTKLDGVSLGDVWYCRALETIHSKDPNHPLSKIGKGLIPFHKLTQWLTYSIMEPIERCLGATFSNNCMTGLAEYRNGGLFIDFGVLVLKEGLIHGDEIPQYGVDEQVVVEWRGLTVALLDHVGERVRKALNMDEHQLPLVKVLEAGTWKAGREIAAKKRPLTKGPPIKIISDGTVF